MCLHCSSACVLYALILQYCAMISMFDSSAANVNDSSCLHCGIICLTNAVFHVLASQEAVLFTRDHDAENKAIALSKLGTLYADVMAQTELALRCSSQVLITVLFSIICAHC
jgi:hypothetical protein